MNRNWLESFTALIAAFGALLAGIGTLWGAVWPAIKGRKKSVRRWGLWLGLALVGVAIAIFSYRIISETYVPLSSKLATQAWDALNRSDYNSANATADECIRDFGGAAEREESKLQIDQVPFPPTGATSPEEKSRILARGVLNDAAACFFIKGEAASKLGRTKDAVDAYQSTIKYAHARIFDPKGDFFWSPAEAASDRLHGLEK